jgi:hypothetical protein
MAPQPQFYDSTDTSQISGTIAANVNAGATFAAVVYHLWNDKGGSLGATDLTDGHLRAVVKDGSSYVTSGYPALDEAWLQARITGADKTGDPTMEDQTTAWTPIGANRTLALADIPANCARYIEVKLVVPAGQANVTQELHLEVVYNQTSRALGGGVSLSTGSGVIPDYYDTSRRRLTSGHTIIAAGTDAVTVDAGGYVYDGLPYFCPPTSITLNQTAADGALTAGQSYIAAIVRNSPGALYASPGGTAVAVKGNRGASPSAPSISATQILIAYVTVTYQGGGTSVINSGNVDTSSARFGEYRLIRPSSGLNLTIGVGRGVTTADTEVFATNHAILAITNNSTRSVYVLSDGTFLAQATTAAQPADSILLGQANASGGNIVAVTHAKTQRMAHDIDRYVMVLRYYGPIGAPLTSLNWDVLPFNGVLESVVAEVGTAPGGAGDTKIDINYEIIGSVPQTTIYTSQATYDYRPSIGVGGYQSDAAVQSHEVVAFEKFTRFWLDIDTTASTPANDLFAYLTFRRLN